MNMKRILPFLAAAAAISCSESEARQNTELQTSVELPMPATVVDSAITVEEALRRFRADLAGKPARLSGGAASRDELVHRFVRAVEEQDTASLRDLVLTRAEFAYLYYPFSRYTRPPMEMEPGLVWFLTQQNSEKGITRVLRRVGGQQLGFAGYQCGSQTVRQERNVLWTGCELDLTMAPTDFQARRLFGTIIERDGHFKLLSYANDL